MKIHLTQVTIGFLFTALLLLSGCVANDESQLDLRHVFNKKITPSQSGFEFVMTWYIPPAELAGSGQSNMFANMGLRSRNQQIPRFSIDNETRLRLEDIAIQRLEDELESNQMCPYGYKIDQIKWLERSIGFIGMCPLADDIN